MNIERIINGCKNLARTGWMQHGIPSSIAETVSDHSFEASILAYLLAIELKKRGVDVNPERAGIIALFHDIGESIIGDLPKWTSERVSNKKELEMDAFKVLGLDPNLFDEYKEAKTNEGLIAKLSDKLSTYLQGVRYSKLGYDVKEIIDSVIDEIENYLKIYPLSLIREKVLEIIKGI
jgi:putative hydrolase of HD superfamily